MNTLNGGRAASEALPGEIEVALRSLASKLQALTYDRGSDDAQRWKQIMHAANGRKDVGGNAYQYGIPLSI